MAAKSLRRSSLALLFCLANPKHSTNPIVAQAFQQAFNKHNSPHISSHREELAASVSQKFPYTYLLLTSREPKCVFFSSSKGTTISIDYSAPQMQPKTKDVFERARNYANSAQDAVKEQMMAQREMVERMGHLNEMEKRHHREWQRDSRPDEDDDYMDMQDPRHRYNKMAHERKLYEKYKDKEDRTIIKITIEETKERHLNPRNYHPYHKPKSFTLALQESRIRYQLENTDYAKVCITSPFATNRQPTFFHFRIKELDDVHLEHNLEDVSPTDGLTEAERIKEKQDMKSGTEHFKWLDRELKKLVNRVDSIERSCHVSKSEHGEFYSQSENMKRSLWKFAAVQLGVLLVTGFLNFNYVIGFLRKKGFVY